MHPINSMATNHLQETIKGKRFLQHLNVLVVEEVFEKSKSSDEKVVEFKHPEDLEHIFDLTLNDATSDAELLQICENVIRYSVKTGHSRFFNQLFGGLDAYGLGGAILTEAINTSMFTYEVAPVFTVMEKALFKKMLALVGFDDGDAIFCPGGSISNMYGMNVARFKRHPDVKTKGMRGLPSLCMLASEKAHFSLMKGASFLGIGTENICTVLSDEKGRLIPKELENRILELRQQEREPFFVNATSGTTVLGAYDPLDEIADVCQKYGLWLHVDAAWGGGALLSNKYRGLMKGSERADSMTWNPHKMMGAPVQCSVFLTRHKNVLPECHSADAHYLFQQDKFYDVSYDTGDKSIQCGRKVDVLKLWLMWKAKGDDQFEKDIDNLFNCSRYLANLVKEKEGFRLVLEPQCTNVCFWYIPPSLRDQNEDEEWFQRLGKIAPIIKERMVKRGSMLIGYQPDGDYVNFFRMIISNLDTTVEDMDFVVNEIDLLGKDLLQVRSTAKVIYGREKLRKKEKPEYALFETGRRIAAGGFGCLELHFRSTAKVIYGREKLKKEKPDADFESYRNVVQRQSRNETFVKLYEDHVQAWDRDSSQQPRSSFPCAPIPSPKPTTSVHTLTANNVDVIAAMGDSITAGNGVKARTVIGLLIENRGLSYSIGGVGAYEQHLTLTNIVKKYDPDVKGFSTGNGNRYSRHSHLNVAVPGAKSDAMKTQAERLVNKMQNEPGVDYENDWKVITIFIGGNDLCAFCHNKEEYSPAKYVDNLKQALDVLIAHIPRAFVNVVPVLNITMMTELNQNIVCDVLHLALCNCAAFPWNDAAKKELEEATVAYYKGLKDLVESGIYDVREDFTVIIQPFFTETPLPRMPNGRPDLGYFAPDCFHLSQKGHEAAATALWNNMLEPVGQKKTAWQPGDPTHCPTQENQYFYTYRNSQFYSGAFEKGLGVKKLTSKETRNGKKQDTVTSASSTALIIGVCLCVVIATGVAVVVYKKVSSTAFKNKNMYVKL